MRWGHSLQSWLPPQHLWAAEGNGARPAETARAAATCRWAGRVGLVGAGFACRPVCRVVCVVSHVCVCVCGEEVGVCAWLGHASMAGVLHNWLYVCV